MTTFVTAVHSLPSVRHVWQTLLKRQSSTSTFSLGPLPGHCAGSSAHGPFPPLTTTASSFTSIVTLRTVKLRHASMSTASVEGPRTPSITSATMVQSCTTTFSQR